MDRIVTTWSTVASPPSAAARPSTEQYVRAPSTAAASGHDEMVVAAPSPPVGRAARAAATSAASFLCISTPGRCARTASDRRRIPSIPGGTNSPATSIATAIASAAVLMAGRPAASAVRAATPSTKRKNRPAESSARNSLASEREE